MRGICVEGHQLMGFSVAGEPKRLISPLNRVRLGTGKLLVQSHLVLYHDGYSPKGPKCNFCRRGERHQKDDGKKTRFRTVPHIRINKLQSNPPKADQGVWYIFENFGFHFFKN